MNSDTCMCDCPKPWSGTSCSGIVNTPIKHQGLTIIGSHFCMTIMYVKYVYVNRGGFDLFKGFAEKQYPNIMFHLHVGRLVSITSYIMRILVNITTCVHARCRTIT